MQAAIDRSPRIVAQRQALDAVFNRAASSTALASPQESFEGDRTHDLPGHFEDIASEAPCSALPGDIRRRFEAAHQVDLTSVRMHVVGMIAHHGVRGLSHGRQVIVADTSDREAIEHELGHVVDNIGIGDAPPNTALDGMPLADDPAREARADQLATQARHATPGASTNAPATAHTPRAASLGTAAQAKLTSRASIGRKAEKFDWAEHKTKPKLAPGGGFAAEGSGAVLSTNAKLASDLSSQHKQLLKLSMTVPPQYFDASRGALPEPAAHPGGHKGAYVVPAALLGAAIDENMLYLPPAALVKLAAVQSQMTDLAQKAAVRIVANTTFGGDGLANRVRLQCEALDRITGFPVAYVLWDTPIETDRAKWGGAAVANTASAGVAPASAEWQTQIRWHPTRASGDGQRVVADKLGPDHPLGSAPQDATAAMRVKKLETASTPKATKTIKNPKAEPYIAGHLLNDHLGGPGNLSANLAPIPRTANSQMSSSIETPAKKIVNNERGWIRYEVEVTEGTDSVSGIAYPSRIDARIDVYKSDGKTKPLGTSSINISQPSDYAKLSGKDAVAPSASNKLDGEAEETTPVMFDQVVLTHENDLRPNLRDGADLFKLMTGAGVNTAVDDSTLGNAWEAVLSELHEFEIGALRHLNLLSTVSTAMEGWRTDKASLMFLQDTNVGDVKRALDASFALANAFLIKSKVMLTRANIAVNAIPPSDLFRNAELIRFADNLVENAPGGVSMFQLIESQLSSSVPYVVHELLDAKSKGDLAAEQRHGKTLLGYQSRPHPPQKLFPISPVRIFESSATSVRDIEERSWYGAKLDSERAPLAVDKLCGMLERGDYTQLSKLLSDPTLKGSLRVSGIIDQIKTVVIDNTWSPEAIDPKIFVMQHRITWTDSIEALGRKEPSVALHLYKLLGVD